MRLFIGPPIHVLSTPGGIRAWQRALAAMRERYRDDPEALACIARAERQADELLALSGGGPNVDPSAR